MTRILCDVDGILADYTGAVCALLPHRKPEDFRSWSLGETLNTSEYAFFKDQMVRRGFCSSIRPYPFARYFVDALRDIGDVCFLTAPTKSPYWHAERVAWIKEHVGASADDIVFAEGKHKVFMRGDVLIEDNADTLDAWAQENPQGCPVLMVRSYNETHPKRGFFSSGVDYNELLACVGGQKKKGP